MFKSRRVVAENKREYPLLNRTYCKNLDRSLSEPLHFIEKKKFFKHFPFLFSSMQHLKHFPVVRSVYIDRNRE